MFLPLFPGPTKTLKADFVAPKLHVAFLLNAAPPPNSVPSKQDTRHGRRIDEPSRREARKKKEKDIE